MSKSQSDFVNKSVRICQLVSQTYSFGISSLPFSLFLYRAWRQRLRDLVHLSYQSTNQCIFWLKNKVQTGMSAYESNMNLNLLIHQFHSTKLKYISALDVYQVGHLVKLYKVIWGHSRSLQMNSPSPADRHQSLNLQCNCNTWKLVIGNSFHKTWRKKFSLNPKQQVSDSPRPAERRADRTAFSS